LEVKSYFPYVAVECARQGKWAPLGYAGTRGEGLGHRISHIGLPPSLSARVFTSGLRCKRYRQPQPWPPMIKWGHRVTDAGVLAYHGAYHPLQYAESDLFASHFRCGVKRVLALQYETLLHGQTDTAGVTDCTRAEEADPSDPDRPRSFAGGTG
jgi:hypothetical protein